MNWSSVDDITWFLFKLWLSFFIYSPLIKSNGHFLENRNVCVNGWMLDLTLSKLNQWSVIRKIQKSFLSWNWSIPYTIPNVSVTIHLFLNWSYSFIMREASWPPNTTYITYVNSNPIAYCHSRVGLTNTLTPNHNDTQEQEREKNNRELRINSNTIPGGKMYNRLSYIPNITKISCK